MKLKLIVVSLIAGLFSTASYAEGDWYFGVGAGKANLKYDVRGKVNGLVNKAFGPYVDQYNVYVNQYNGTYTDPYGLGQTVTLALPLLSTDMFAKQVDLKESFNQDSYNVFLGYKFTKKFSVELGRQQTESFVATASLPINVSINESASYTDTSGDVYQASLQANANGFAYATAEAKAATTSLSLMYRFVDTEDVSLFVKAGAAYGKADIKTSVQYSYSYSYAYSYSYSGTCPVSSPIPCSGSGSQQGSASGVENNRLTYTTFLPVYGFGGEYNINKDYAVRAEYSRIGIPSTHIDSYSASFIVRF